MFKKILLHFVVMCLPSCQMLANPEVESDIIQGAEILLEDTDQILEQKAGEHPA